MMSCSDLYFCSVSWTRAGDLVMLLADDRRGQHAAGRIERVDRRIDAELRDARG